ncbi:hypothetical protein BV25DRAFT_1268108 [Artomyces pyxidatus]|uniref:Uncharacterized protein n=1 Tax=Artomyces pyxidatus TaxID=48021 RepID=A0ACB8TF12_9AGAM|nr:hypothetical protein BV25DRAFT_1268108 [Artomyces pyxidatus]
MARGAEGMRHWPGAREHVAGDAAAGDRGEGGAARAVGGGGEHGSRTAAAASPPAEGPPAEGAPEKSTKKRAKAPFRAWKRIRKVVSGSMRLHRRASPDVGAMTRATDRGSMPQCDETEHGVRFCYCRRFRQWSRAPYPRRERDDAGHRYSYSNARRPRPRAWEASAGEGSGRVAAPTERVQESSYGSGANPARIADGGRDACYGH